MEYTVLVAEDESIEREYLQKLVAGIHPQITKVITAVNGQDAVEKFQKEQPDVILIDINMPVKDGLSALQEMKETALKPFVSIVLTSYSDFSFAQKGIQLQISDYILKPAQDHKICESISVALEKLQSQYNFDHSIHSLFSHAQKIQTIVEADLIHAIIHQAEENTIRRYFDMMIGNVFDNAVCLIITKEVEQTILADIKERCFDSGYSCFMAELPECYVYYLFFASPIEESDIKKMDQIISHHLQDHACLWGNPKTKLSDFYLSFQEAYAKWQTQNNESKIQDDQTFMQEQSQKLIAMVEENTSSIIIYELALSLLREPTERRNSLLKGIWQNIFSFAKANHITDIPEQEWEDVFYDSASFQDVIYLTTEKLVKILKPIKMHLHANHSWIYQKAITYIKQNYKKPISLEDVGKELDVTPQYISRIISKESTRKDMNSFPSLVTHYRMEEAMRLIRQHHPLKNIASEVGFRSIHYFSNSFKKYTGMSPREYQKIFEQDQ